MKKDVMKKWVETLRSGKYKQGAGFLRHDDKYCCLGVLCELATQEGICERSEGLKRFKYDYLEISPPDSVMAWSGLKDIEGFFGDDSLMNLNDNGTSFETIADIIELKYKNL